MAYEEVQDLAQPTDSHAAASASSFNTAPSAKALVRAVEYHVASALPRRIGDSMLAAALGAPIEALRAAFARVHGESTYRALLKMRVRLVDLTLKADPELSPRAVAQVCGFGYFGRFHQLYRRDTGRSPQTRIERGGVDADALDRARKAVAATVERVFRPTVEPGVVASDQRTQGVVPGEARSVETADPRIPADLQRGGDSKS
jgi:AraC-like DNA-binding protein